MACLSTRRTNRSTSNCTGGICRSFVPVSTKSSSPRLYPRHARHAVRSTREDLNSEAVPSRVARSEPDITKAFEFELQSAQAEDSSERPPHSSNSVRAGDEPSFQPVTKQSTLVPKLLLLLTALLWGTYAPSLRLVYTSDSPPDPVVVMAIRGVIQSLTLIAASSLPALGGRQPGQAVPTPGQQQQLGQGPGPPQQQEVQQQHMGDVLHRWASLRDPPLWMAAVELGLWNFMATACQTFGLQLTSATRAGFLIQATALLTPLLATLGGERLGGRVWAGCGLALGGTLLIVAERVEGGKAAADAAGLALGGDVAILLAALFYSLATVRLSGYARTLPSVQIATGKTLVLAGAALSSLAVAASSLAARGTPLTTLWEGWGDLPTWGILAWSAVGPGALAAYLHVKGQAAVPPAEAQVIFSSVPLWSAGFAWVLLGGEQLGPLTWVGGGVVVAAGLVASLPPSDRSTPGAVATDKRL